MSRMHERHSPIGRVCASIVVIAALCVACAARKVPEARTLTNIENLCVSSYDIPCGGAALRQTPPARCARLAAWLHPTAVTEQNGECLVSCDQGEWGGYVATYRPDATSREQARCEGLYVVDAFVEVGGATLVFQRAPLPGGCRSSVGRLVTGKYGWEIEPIATFDAWVLAYTREGSSIVVELGWPWKSAERTRARVDATHVDPL